MSLFPLYPHQERAIAMLRESLRSSHRRPVLSLPTGAGKTVIAANIATSALAKRNRVGFVVPMLNLVDQTFSRFVSNGIDPADMGVIQGNHAWRRPAAPLQICSVQTLDRRGFPDVKFVIVDESHMRFKAIDRWMQAFPEIVFVGLSATPWSRGMGDVWDDLIVPTTLRELIDLGWLAKYRVFAAAAKVDLSAVKTVAGDYHEGQLADVMGAKTIVADVVSNWLEKGEGRPTLCFAVNRAHAATLHDQFAAAGVGSAYIDGNTPREEREAILERYRRGEVQVICSVGTMTTGVDVPCRCLILARPTKSEILHVQMFGRGLRTEAEKADCVVFDHAGNCQRLGMPTSIGRTSLRTAKSDAEEKERGEKGEAKRVEPLPRECGVCHTLLPPKTPVCPTCGASMRRPSDVETVDGELIEMGTQAKAKKETALARLEKLGKQAIYSQLLDAEPNKSPGFRAHKFRAIFGVWPRGLAEVRAPASPELRSWLHSQRIAWVKSKQSDSKAREATADDARGLVDAA